MMRPHRWLEPQQDGAALGCRAVRVTGHIVSTNATDIHPTPMPPPRNPVTRLVAAAGLILAGCLAFGLPAARAEELSFDVPAAIATAQSVTHMDADYYPFPIVPKAHYAFVREDQPIGNTQYVSSGTAQAVATLDGYSVMAHVSSGGLAVAEAYMMFIPEDPQKRDQVKVTLKFKASATTGSGQGSASWQFRVGSPAGSWFVRTRSDGTISFIETPQIDAPADLEVDGTYRRAENNPDGGGAVVVFRNGVVVEQRLTSGAAADARSIDLNVAPNGGYLMAIVAGAGSSTLGNSGMAVLDPVVLPHPDNPDVVVHMYRAAADDTPRSPLAGITAEQLVAEGLDIESLQALGFFGSPTPDDVTPPSTLASATPGPNANGWNKGPVTVSLTATDNAGGSGVKEIHVALSGATIGQRVATGDSPNLEISAEGITTLSYFAVDNAGNQEAPKTLTVKIDQTGPTLTGLPAAGCSLWPPNHRLVQVASITASDSLSGPAGPPIVTATSNEPTSGIGDGDPAPDIVISGGVVEVRAERAGSGPGRTYTITGTVTDFAGNTTTATATCQVPHDQRRMAQP